MNAELIDAIKEIKVLEEKKARLVSMNEENDSEIAKLKSSDSLLNEHIQNVEHNFTSLATFPWSYSSAVLKVVFDDEYWYGGLTLTSVFLNSNLFQALTSFKISPLLFKSDKQNPPGN
ncbi:hypothetical protein Dsin_013479 [Dipteronia sinensis]|uniref:Uncharacterized protein n=1 Tax=Dipteronia sinensis TaxID=43782 RepID=A0AAE0AL93_9ROSI|nr:hypothetical protein Dsin_013479 [Dipteronia sinensis]